jgi:hypothetical protein
MKKLATLLILLLVMAMSTSAALTPVRLSVTSSTPSPSTVRQLTVDILDPTGSVVIKSINKGTVTTDEVGLLSFVLDATDLSDQTYNANNLFRVTYNNVIVGLERMADVYAKQSLFGILIDPSEIAAGSAGTVLTSNGTTNTWIAPANDWHITGNSGTSAGTNFIGTTDNQALIFKVQDNLSGQINYASPYTTSFGYQSLSSASLSGIYNTAFGYQALSANTTGQTNTAIGYSALNANTAGNGNSAVGTFALNLNIGSFNTAVGNSALNANTDGINNTATGYQALSSLTGSNSYNTAYGYQAFLNLTSGNYNIAIGNVAGITTGINPVTNTENSIYLGSFTEASAASGATNEIVIGFGAHGNGSNSVTLGNASILNTYLHGAVTATTFNGLTPTALATGFTIAGGTTSKTLTVPLDASVSGTNTGDVTEITDEPTASAGQTSFTLSHTPSAKCVVKMYINGVRISKTACSWTSGTTATYIPANNGGYVLLGTERIQIDYFY